MGLMCSVENQDKFDPRISRKISLVKKQTMKSQTEASQEKLILQCLKNKISGSVQKANILQGFQVISQLGKGGQADVIEIKFNSYKLLQQGVSTSCQRSYALRRIYKNNMINNRQSIQLGKSILMREDCPFLMNAFLFTEDQEFYYQVMEVATGGDLKTFIEPNTFKQSCFRSLGQQGIKFIIAGIILGIQNLHKNGIIFCDLKLQNVLICSDGYPKLTDFDSAFKGRFIKSACYKGTSNYLAPQIFIDSQVDHGMDIWALGVVIYALAYGVTPFSNEQISNPNYTIEAMKRQGKYTQSDRKISSQLSSLINQLLKVNPRKRLGYCSFSQIKGHSFFKGFDWFKYQRKEIENPIFGIFEKIEQNKKNQIVKAKALLVKRKLSFSKKRKQSADRQTQCDQFCQIDCI